MKNLFLSTLLLFGAGFLAVACGRDMRALTAASFDKSIDTVNGNLQVAKDIDAAATALAGRFFANLFDSQQEQELHSRLIGEIGGLELVVNNAANNQKRLGVRLAEKGCTNLTALQSIVNEAQINNRNSVVNFGTEKGYSVQMVCLPSTQNGVTGCHHFLLAVTKTYGLSSGSFVTVMGRHPVTGQYISWKTTNSIMNYFAVKNLQEVCTDTQLANPNPGWPVVNNPGANNNTNPGANNGNTTGNNNGTAQGDVTPVETIDYDDIYSDIILADPNGDVSLNPFEVDSMNGTTTDVATGDTTLNPFVVAPGSGGGQNSGQGTTVIDFNTPFETVPVDGSEPDFFQGDVF